MGAMRSSPGEVVGSDADGIAATLAMVDRSVNTAKQYVIFRWGPKSARRKHVTQR